MRVNSFLPELKCNAGPAALLYKQCSLLNQVPREGAVTLQVIFIFDTIVGVTCSQGTGNSAYEDGLAGVKRLRAVHDEIAVAQVPRPDLDLRDEGVAVGCLFETFQAR